MTTAIDTNVIVALWDAQDSLHRVARAALDKVFSEGTLVISGAGYAELLAAPGRTEEFIDRFCEETGIVVEWEIRGYSARRRKQKGAEAKRILADFVIGAHALVNRYRLLTLDAGIYQASFPKLAIAMA